MGSSSKCYKRTTLEIEKKNLNQKLSNRKNINNTIPIMHRTQIQNRNNMYHRGSNTPRYQRHHQPSKTDRFEESSDSAFFLGKLNKHLDRETIYRALTAEARRLNFYVRKLDMPYGDSRYKTGNKGYAFVHCRTKEEIERKVEEIKSYRQRTSTMSSNSISENDEPFSYSNDNNNTSQSIDELHLEVQHQPDIPEEMETTTTPEYVQQQESTNYSSVFTHENVTPFILAKQTEAMAAGMTAEQFNMAFVAFYEMRLQQLQQLENAEDVANLQFGLYQKMQQICN